MTTRCSAQKAECEGTGQSYKDREDSCTDRKNYNNVRYSADHVSAQPSLTFDSAADMTGGKDSWKDVGGGGIEIQIKQEPVDWTMDEEDGGEEEKRGMEGANVDTCSTAVLKNPDEENGSVTQKTRTGRGGSLRVRLWNHEEQHLKIKSEPLDLSTNPSSSDREQSKPSFKQADPAHQQNAFTNCVGLQPVGHSAPPVNVVSSVTDNNQSDKEDLDNCEESGLGNTGDKDCIKKEIADDEDMLSEENDEDVDMESLPIHFQSAAQNRVRTSKRKSNPSRRKGKGTPCVDDGRSPPFEPGVRDRYQCSLCREEFPNKAELLQHTKNPASSENLPRCVERLASQVVAENDRSSQGSFQCELCPAGSAMTFHSVTDLELHQKVHRPKSPIQCPHCPKVFSSENQLGGHLKVHFGQLRRQCQHCSLEFNCAYDCRQHENTVHSDKKSLNCVFRPLANTEAPKPPEKPVKVRGPTNHSQALALKKGPKAKKAKTQDRTERKQGADSKSEGKSKTRSCPHCGREFTNAKNLRSHVRVHSEVKPYTCDQCSAAFVRSSDLNRHKKTHTGEKAYKCQLCHSAFADSSKLRIHMRVHTGEKPFKCNLCHEAFSQASQYERHRRVHSGERPFQCQYCPSSFTMNSDYRRHLRIHTGERPFMCEYCPATFPEGKNLRIHMRTHTGEKPYKCEFCSAAFAQTANLKRHIKTHTGEKPAKCELCPAAFADNHKLKVHMRSHSGEKPYQCQLCSSSFATSSALNRHSIIHSGEKPYKCDHCPAVFAIVRRLKQHEACHSADGLFKCQYCTASFKNAYGLTVHSHVHPPTADSDRKK